MHSPALICNSATKAHVILLPWGCSVIRQTGALLEVAGTACQSLQQFHSTTSSCSEAEDTTEGQTEASSSGTADSSAQPARVPFHAPHLSLNDPYFDIRLTYNKQCITNADRKYAIGHENHFEKTHRIELQKALAAQRLNLRDAAAVAAGRRQPPIRDQMLARLADLQQACRR